MKTLTVSPRKLLLTAMSLVLGAAFAAPAVAQDEGSGGMPPMGRPEQMDKVAPMQGDWDVAIKYRMSPEMPWQESTGHATSKAILDGCAQRMDFTGNFMGMTMHGFDITTYNRETGQFESAWVDDMGARMSTMAGNFNDAGELVMKGEDMQSGMKMHTRATSKMGDDEVTWTMEMSMDGGKTWFANMEMVYTRAD